MTATWFPDVAAADAANPQGCGTKGHDIACLCDVDLSLAPTYTEIHLPRWQHVAGDARNLVVGEANLSTTCRLLYAVDLLAQGVKA